MIELFLIKEMVDKMSSKQKLWVYVKNEKMILNFYSHRKSSGLTIS